jgi:NDP-sugar pyrophosphorylase family protein
MAMSRPGYPRVSDLQAVILAGGKGTRLRGVVDDKPKALAEVAGRPFIDWILLGLLDHGVRRVVFCTGYLGDHIEDHVRTLCVEGLEISYSPEANPLGTAGALRQALPLLDSDPLLVLNGDSWCDFRAVLFLNWHLSVRSRASLLLVRTSDTARYGSVEVAAKGRILRFREKDPAGQPGWINAGVYLLARSCVSGLEPNKPVSLEYEVFPRLIPEGLYGFCTTCSFIDIGTPESYRQSQEFFQKRHGRFRSAGLLCERTS